ncbi:fimbrial protein [Leclercia sp. J807]|uniref:fimbrial protein n=1 Tax=Leclercia TaxID=83654 RepID=UPI000DF2C770|nr:MULTISPECIES: fimbrial protein [Leclercia]MCG1031242.1 type 1 fimbrial protein [Bacillus amyloliquefaciens]AXF62547.1 type 1 fimbrial protein [Leclercia sp. W6]AXF67040.1 type 1 fimbrial protein [Leclercia sp. W17]QGU10035.1 fimbrial protein [Leclercia sp. J807]WNY88068.1 type 1 fimbrial protein [Leclercia adecarboxylata]
MKYVALLVLLASLPVSATDVLLSIKGNIYDTACEVDSTSQNKVVDLGQAVASDFKAPGDVGVWKNFDITLSHCPQSLTLATINLEGKRDTLHPFKFANTGTARGLALELADRTDSIILAPEARFNAVIDPITHTADFPMAARYYASYVPVHAGEFSSTVLFTFTYQ